jgi:hypothetical protein
MSPHLRVFKRSLATLHCGEKNIPRDLLQRNIHGGARTLVDPPLRPRGKARVGIDSVAES